MCICRSLVPYRNFVSSIPNHYTPIVFKSTEDINKLLKKKILINQSLKPVTNRTIELLSLGLNFIPSNCGTKNSLTNPVNRLIKDINTRIFFLQKTKKENRKGWLTKFTNSNWTPEQQSWTTDPRIMPLLNSISSPTPSLSMKNHQELIKEIIRLKKRKDIHILKSDKGRNTVIWDILDYNKEANRQLSDTTTYLELSETDYKCKLQQIKLLCCELSENLLALRHITELEDEAICKSPAEGSSIYFLPKIHKQMHPSSKTFPGRPIVATYSAVTYLLDKYITEITSGLLRIIPGSLIDTNNFIQNLPTKALPNSSMLVTADVVSLYPNIPWEEGISSSTEFYKSNLESLRNEAILKNKLPPPSPMLFERILTLIISNSMINFKNQRFFHQIKGTAMGCCISVYFANCYMYSLTKNILLNPPSWLLSFLRFIDDIFLITTEDNFSNLKELMATISNCNIHYELEAPAKKQSFLDTTITIHKKTNVLIIEPHSKDTASGSYLHPSSMHPGHIIRATPYSQLLRIRRISSSRFIFRKHAKTMLQNFRNMGYRRKDLSRTYKQVFNMTVKDLTQKTTKSDTATSFKFITPFNQAFNWSLTQEKLNLLRNALQLHYTEEGPYQNSKLADFFQNKQIKLVFSNDRNLSSNFSAQTKK